MGIGACLLGYADPVVNQAVKKTINNGSMSTLNCPAEVELAELLLEIHPWAGMVRFARTGGEILAVAIRIARAYTGKNHIAFCGYHGWHDWYLSANLGSEKALDGHLLAGLNPNGIPRGLKGTMHPFHYNKLEELESIINDYGQDIGVIIMEPLRYSEPQEEFLEKVRQIANSNGSVLIFDEISCGWRHIIGGAHLLFGVIPDMAVFAKALSNGFPCAAVIGKEKIMQAAQDTFISSTYWTEAIGFTAACATIKEFKNRKAPDALYEYGSRVREIWKRIAFKHSISIKISGRPAYSCFDFEYKDPLILSTLLTQEMLERGFLVGNVFIPSCAHTNKLLGKYEAALDEVFKIIIRAVADGNPEVYLKGPKA